MTKTKEADLHNSTTHHFFASPEERRLHLGQQMESGGRTAASDSERTSRAVPHAAGRGQLSALQSAQREAERHTDRAPSPARPKDVPGWPPTRTRGRMETQSPSLNVKPGVLCFGSHISRRSPVESPARKDAKTKASGGGKLAGDSASFAASLSKTPEAKNTGGGRKVGCGPGKLSATDSSSARSDCASDENKPCAEAACIDAGSDSGRDGRMAGDKRKSNGALADPASQKAASKTALFSAERDYKDRLFLGVNTEEENISSPCEQRPVSVPVSTSSAFSDFTEEFLSGTHEELVREIEELRSEKDYLKDEMEELRSEMLEMRDMFMEEHVYQLQEQRQQLAQANKTCQILQYRLRKSERRSLRVAQTGQVGGELIRTMEQDVRVAKDVSIRLHNQLDNIEKKRSRLEEENEELRIQLQDLEVTKQVLQQEIDKNSQKKRGIRPNKPHKKLSTQEDSSDLMCQLQFAKEESALMCKKLTTLVKSSEAMKEELAKYRSLYGDVNASLNIEVADSPHTREAEIRVHLKLVEEEANLLSRRIVELDMENRGLRAEMDDMKGTQDGSQELTTVNSGLRSGLGLGGEAMIHGGTSPENIMELQRHLQFVEEEAELLRRSLIEMEEQNKLLMNEINRYKSEPPQLSSTSSLTSLSDELLINCPVPSIQEGAVLISPDSPTQEEELRFARLQIGELSEKVKKLQYDNRVLLSNLQRCDLASCHVPSSSFSSSSLQLTLESDVEAGDSPGCFSNSPSPRKVSEGCENDALEVEEQKKKTDDNFHTTTSLPGYLRHKDHGILLAIREQAHLVSTAIQLLISPESHCLFSFPSINDNDYSNNTEESGDLEKHQPHSYISELTELAYQSPVSALTTRLQALYIQLQAFVEQVDLLFKPHGGAVQVEGTSPLASPCTSQLFSGHDQDGLNTTKEKMQEEHQRALLHRDFQVQSLGLQAQLQQKLWTQERSLLVEEFQHLKQALFLNCLKLRCFLKQWRLGCKDKEWKDILEINNLNDLYLLLDEEKLTTPTHQTAKRTAAEEQPRPAIRSSAVTSTLADMKLVLQDLSGELCQERQSSQELTQQFAKAKASWELERTELKNLITQLETKVGKAAALSITDVLEPPDLKVALKREREEHQHLLAESYTAVMDLTKQLQIGERNWARERLELLERFSQERSQWEQRLREATAQQGKLKALGGEFSSDTAVTKGTGLSRTKSTSVLGAPEVNRTTNLEEKVQFIVPPLPIHPELSGPTKKNWTYLTDESQTRDFGGTCKTWDGPSGPCSSLTGSELDSIQRSYTAPDRTSIRIYYSPPAVRRMEQRRRKEEPQRARNGSFSLDLSSSEVGVAVANTLEVQQQSFFSSSYDQWLSSPSKQHKELQESRNGCIPASIPSVITDNIGRSTTNVADGITPSCAFHGLDIGEISANLSDDMKEMTNCVRQAIRASPLDRKSTKDPGSQVIGMSSRSTQTAAQYVSIGLQTDNLPSSKGIGLHSKTCSPRLSSATTSSSLASTRTRQISTSLDKVHSRTERPCCLPKYGSPKLRRVSSGSTSRLDGTSSSRDRNVWSLQQRAIGGGGGSAWARSTTTRDSPILSGLTDGLSSLFSVVEHSGSTESLWRGDGGASQGTSPQRQLLAAGKPSSTAILDQEFFRNVCSSRGQGGVTLPEEKAQQDSQGSLGGLSVLGGFCHVDECKPECVSARVVLQAGLCEGNDSVTRIVNKRLMRWTSGEKVVNIIRGGKEKMSNVGATGSGTEDAACDFAAQSSCFIRPSRAATHHSPSQCKHGSQESLAATEERGDTSNTDS